MTIPSRTDDKFSWDATWEGRKARLDLTTKVLWGQVLKRVTLQGRSYCEIGAGRGVFGRLALQAGASRVCLVDRSPEAIRLCREFLGDDERVSYVLADAAEYEAEQKFDVVLSNGLIEHFVGADQDLIVQAHIAQSRDLVVLMTPASPHFNDRRVRYPWALKLYGPQFPLTLAGMRSVLERAGLEVVLVERFYPLYSIKLNRLFPFQNRLLAALDLVLLKIGLYHLATWLTNPLGKRLGGYLLAVGRLPGA